MTEAALDPGAFWRAIGNRATGATIAAAQDADGPAGLLALSATHLSAAPPMMMVAVGAGTSALATILNARHFSLNLLATGDARLAEVFGGRAGISGADRFEPGRWRTLPSGAPGLVGALAVLDCTLEDSLERFGTTIVIGRLTGVQSDPALAPLVSFRGRMVEGLAS